jgi:hypothetical protein
MSIVALRPPEPDLADAGERERALWQGLVTLTRIAIEAREREAEHVARLAAVEADQAEIKARLPRRKITAPPGWLSAQQAAHAIGMPLSTFYRKWGKLRIIGKRTDSCFMFDPASLPVRKL